MNAPLDQAVLKALADVTLDDKYTLEKGRAYMSGSPRPGGWPEHRGLYLRLSRFAAGRPGPGLVEGQATPCGQRHHLPARAE
jgi:hypothetical protein